LFGETSRDLFGEPPDGDKLLICIPIVGITAKKLPGKVSGS